jgi:hypothetical protein
MFLGIYASKGRTGDALVGDSRVDPLPLTGTYLRLKVDGGSAEEPVGNLTKGRLEFANGEAFADDVSLVAASRVGREHRA